MDKCPICGHMEVVTMKKFTHAMSEYVSSDGKSAGIFNSDEPKITVQPKGKPQSELTRKDVYEKVKSEEVYAAAEKKSQMDKLGVERAKADTLKAQETAKAAGKTVVVPVVASVEEALKTVPVSSETKPLLTS